MVDTTSESGRSQANKEMPEMPLTQAQQLVQKGLLPEAAIPEFEKYSKQAAALLEKIWTDETEKEVKENLKDKDFYSDPEALCRFFIARECDEQEALKMYEGWVRWRAEFKADYIDAVALRPMLAKETIVFGGIDKQNRLSVVCRPRYHDPNAQQLDELIRYGIYIMEVAIRRITLENLNPKIVCFYDRTGMSSANRDSGIIKFTMQFVKLLQDYYAERLAVMYVIQANWISKAAFMVIKPFLSQATKDKFIMVSNLNQIQDTFEPDQLFTEYGGSWDFKYDPDK